MEQAIKKEKQTLIAPGRDIVASYAQELRRNLWSLIEEGVTDVTIDLAGVQMIDSIGLGVLIAAHNSLKKKQGRRNIYTVNRKGRLRHPLESHHTVGALLDTLA